MNKLKFAIFGCGRMGRHHSEQLQKDGRGDVVALMDPCIDSARQLQRDLWPDAFITSSIEEILSRDNIDAAMICTPTAEHFSQATHCLDRSWHVLCEKPLAATRREIVELIERSEIARSKHQAFALGYQRRHTSLYKAARHEVRSGRWGKVRALVSHNVENWQSMIPGTWRDDPAQNPGGFVTDAGSHKIDSLFYVTGLKPVEVFARSQTWGSHVEIVTSASALLTENVTATIDFIGHAQYLGEDLSIHCEKGDLLLRHGELWIGQKGRLERLPYDDQNSTPVTSLIDSILLQTEEISPPSAALPVFDLTQAILESSRTRKLVEIVV